MIAIKHQNDKLQRQKYRVDALLLPHVRVEDEDLCNERLLEELIRRWAIANNKTASIGIVRERR